MEVKSTVEIVIEKDKNIYRFMMPVGVGYGEAYDACFAALDKIKDMASQAVEKSRREVEKKEE